MTYLMHGLRAVSVTPWTCRRRPSLVIILTHAKCSNARRSRWQTNSAVQVTTHESKVNGPVTTRPAPLATRARGEGESLPVYLFKLGKSCVFFLSSIYPFERDKKPATDSPQKNIQTSHSTKQAFKTSGPTTVKAAVSVTSSPRRRKTPWRKRYRAGC